jgi:UDPglucose 6-dehydrogenase
LPSKIKFCCPGIAGVGVVGGALRAYLQRRGLEPPLYDPGLGFTNVEALNSCDIVFACVPTPYHLDSGFDASVLDDAIGALKGEKTVVIKSTVLPGTTDRLQSDYPQHRFLFNPEFLREKTALADFLEPDRQIVGFSRRWDRELAQAVLDLLPRAPYEAVVPAAAAEMIKYATNAFLALKVIFANELYDLSSVLGIDYAEVRAGISADERIGDSHLDVDDRGYRGYGGKCLPKDTMALLDLSREFGVPLQVLEAAHRVNLSLRGEAICEDLATGGSAVFSDVLAA